MNTLTTLLNNVNNFTKDAYWDYFLIKKAKDSQELLTVADQFDIKDEELFNQFEAFINAYRELVAILGMSADNLNPEAFEEAGQLIDTLKTRYDRIMNNPYLNGNAEEGYEEDFDPGSFTQFLSDVAQDAENKLKAVAGEDVDISELRAAQYAREFNAIEEEYEGTKQDEWSAHRVQKAMENRKKWFENLMAIKKLNINDPRYQSYIKIRRQSYQSIMSDPDRKAAYREAARQRQAKFSKKIQLKRDYLILLRSKTNDPNKLKEYDQEIAEIDTILNKKLNKSQMLAKKIKEKKEAKDLAGLTLHLQQKIASLKKDTVKSVKEKAKNDSFFLPYKKAVQEATSAYYKEPTPQTQALVNEAIQHEAEALKNYLDNHPVAQSVRAETEKLYALRDKGKELSKSNWFAGEKAPEVAQPFLHEFINETEKLIMEMGKYRGIVATLTEINNLIRSKL